MKKRNLLLLVCILLAVALVMVSCGKKNNDETPHQHTFDTNNWTSDATGHWHAATCDDAAGAKLGFAAHSDIDKDGVCDECEYVTCTHTYDTTVWVSDENNHWHAANCGCNVISDSAAHADEDKNGLCDTCEYVTCEHTFAEEYSVDENGHWLDYTCGCVIEPTVEEHNDANKDGNCDACNYVLCAHNPEADWSYDFDSHWHASSCDCLVKIEEAGHDFSNGDTCSVCGYVCTHDLKDEWSYDENNHWHDAKCVHEIELITEAHIDDNMDGKCDVCEYEDPNHEHTWAIAYNKHQHYSYSTCEHIIVKNFVNHVDEDNDGSCDVCHASIEDLSEIVDNVTSEEASNKVNGGTVYNDLDKTSVYTEYTFYADYTSYTLWGEQYYLSLYEVDGMTKLLKVSVGESANRDFYAEDVSEMNGPNISIMYNYISGIGVENFIYALYDYATNGAQQIYNFADAYDEGTGTLTFSFARLEESEYMPDCVQSYSVSLTIADGVITNATVTAYEYADGSYMLDTDANVFIPFPDAVASTSYTFVIEQNVGNRLGAEDEGYVANPYSADNILLKDIQLHVNTRSTDENYNYVYTPTGVVITEGCVIEIAPGYSNGFFLCLTEADASLAAFNVFNVHTEAATGWSNYPIQIYATEEGTFPVTIVTDFGSISFIVEAKLNPPTKLDPAVVVDGNKTEATTVTTYAGLGITVGAISADTESSLTTATVTSGNADAVTITEDGSNWYVVASEVGTYTITLTSVSAPEVSTSITVVAEAAPTAAELLKGTWEFLDGWNEAISLGFIPESEGATSGTVVIDFNDGSWYNPTVIQETATYSYADGAITLTHVSGDGLDNVVGIYITEDFRISIEVNPDWPTEYVLEKTSDNVETEDTPGSGDDEVTLEALAGTWSGSEAGGIMALTATLTINADGTGSGSYNDGWGHSFNIVGMSVSGNTVVMTYNEGRSDKTMTFTYSNGTLTSTQGFYGGTLTLTKEAGNDDVEDEGLTLEDLAGTWSGSEAGGIMALTATLTINADGTGSGSYNDGWDRSFTIEGVTINDTTVTVAYNNGRVTQYLEFTYEDGTLTSATGFYGGTLTLNKEA